MNNLEAKIIGARLKYLRESQELIREVVSDKLGLKLMTYKGYEEGKELPSFPEILKIADLYSVSIDFIIGRSDNFNLVTELKLSMLLSYREIDILEKTKILTERKLNNSRKELILEAEKQGFKGDKCLKLREEITNLEYEESLTSNLIIQERKTYNNLLDKYKEALKNVPYAKIDILKVEAHIRDRVINRLGAFQSLTAI